MKTTLVHNVIWAAILKRECVCYKHSLLEGFIIVINMLNSFMCTLLLTWSAIIAQF